MTVRYLLDTNICIYIAKKRPLEVYQRLSELSIGDVGMSLLPLVSYGLALKKANIKRLRWKNWNS